MIHIDDSPSDLDGIPRIVGVTASLLTRPRVASTSKAPKAPSANKGKEAEKPASEAPLKAASTTVEKRVEAPSSGTAPKAASNIATRQGQGPVVIVTKPTGTMTSTAQPTTANFDVCMTKFKKKIDHWSKYFEKMVGELEARQKLEKNKVTELAEAKKTLTLQLANAEQQVKNDVEAASRMKADYEKRLHDKDTELKMTNLTINQVANIVHEMAADFFSPQSPFCDKIAGDKLNIMKEYCPRLKTAVYNALLELILEKSLPKTLDGLLDKVEKLSQYFWHWKNSATRAGVNRALALVKSHHPDVNVGVVTSRIPE